MKSIYIGNQEFSIKDYYCSQGEEYPPKEDGKLWLYVNLTDVCNGNCQFCINPMVHKREAKIDSIAFKSALEQIKDYIHGISITGGEPMLYPDLVNEVIHISQEVCGDIEKDMVTNGTGFAKIADKIDLKLLDSVHLSRHAVDDKENNEIFGFSTTSSEEIAEVVSRIDDPAKIVLNCILMSGGIEDREKAIKFLEYAAGLGVRNVSFIGLSKHNSFCREHFINPQQLAFSKDSRFHIWNEYHDHEYCFCSSGDFESSNGPIRYYFRCIGDIKAPYARQIVYSSDNRLLAGFSGKEIRFE